MRDPEGQEVAIDDAVDAYFSAMPAEEAYDAILARADYARKEPNQHINWFTSEKLIVLVKEAGFEHAVCTSYGQSICPLMRNKAYFDHTRPNESPMWTGSKASLISRSATLLHDASGGPIGLDRHSTGRGNESQSGSNDGVSRWQLRKRLARMLQPEIGKNRNKERTDHQKNSITENCIGRCRTRCRKV